MTKQILRNAAYLISVFIVLLSCCVYAEDVSFVRNKDIEKSGLALGVQNLWLGQDVKGQSDIFTNDTKEMVYYASFKNLTNVNLFQAKIYMIEWIDPDGEKYFSDTVTTAYGNNNLVYSKLKILGSLASEKLGTWTCKFYKKGVLFDAKHFLLEAPGAEEKRLAEAARLREEMQLVKMKEAAAAEAKRMAESNVVNSQNAVSSGDAPAHSKSIQSTTEAQPSDVVTTNGTFDVNARPAIRSGGRILIIGPQLVYENAYTEQRFGATDNSTQVIVNAELPSKATEVMVSVGLVPISAGQIDDSQKDELSAACRKVEQNIEELIKQRKDKTAFAREFKVLRDSYQCDGMLVQFIKAKLGAGGAWDFAGSGTVVPGTSTTTIKAALINLSTGTIEWSNSVIERDMPQKYVIKKCIGRLFDNFPGYSKQ